MTGIQVIALLAVIFVLVPTFALLGYFEVLRFKDEAGVRKQTQGIRKGVILEDIAARAEAKKGRNATKREFFNQKAEEKQLDELAAIQEKINKTSAKKLLKKQLKLAKKENKKQKTAPTPAGN